MARGLAVSSVNQRLSAVRLLFRQAAERGALSAEEALRLGSVANVKQAGQRLGRWLTEGEAGKLLSVPDAHTRLGIRDRSYALRARRLGRALLAKSFQDKAIHTLDTLELVLGCRLHCI